MIQLNNPWKHHLLPLQVGAVLRALCRNGLRRRAAAAVNWKLEARLIAAALPVSEEHFATIGVRRATGIRTQVYVVQICTTHFPVPLTSKRGEEKGATKQHSKTKRLCQPEILHLRPLLML